MHRVRDCSDKGSQLLGGLEISKWLLINVTQLFFHLGTPFLVLEGVSGTAAGEFCKGDCEWNTLCGVSAVWHLRALLYCMWHNWGLLRTSGLNLIRKTHQVTLDWIPKELGGGHQGWGGCQKAHRSREKRKNDGKRFKLAKRSVSLIVPIISLTQARSLLEGQTN